jgi:predicted HTH transcriptional regulator
MNQLPVSANSSKSAQKKKKIALTPLQIDRWCAGGETRTIEFKQNAKLDGGDIVAMANGGGGVFLLGVEDTNVKGVQKGKVIGVGVGQSYDSIRLAVISACKQCMPTIQPRIQKVRHPKGLVVAVFIDKPHTVTCTSGGTYECTHSQPESEAGPGPLRGFFM